METSKGQKIVRRLKHFAEALERGEDITEQFDTRTVQVNPYESPTSDAQAEPLPERKAFWKSLSFVIYLHLFGILLALIATYIDQYHGQLPRPFELVLDFAFFTSVVTLCGCPLVMLFRLKRSKAELHTKIGLFFLEAILVVIHVFVMLVRVVE